MSCGWRSDGGLRTGSTSGMRLRIRAGAGRCSNDQTANSRGAQKLPVLGPRSGGRTQPAASLRRRRAAAEPSRSAPGDCQRFRPSLACDGDTMDKYPARLANFQLGSAVLGASLLGGLRMICWTASPRHSRQPGLRLGGGFRADMVPCRGKTPWCRRRDSTADQRIESGGDARTVSWAGGMGLQ